MNWDTDDRHRLTTLARLKREVWGREAKQDGADILLPVAIDYFVFKEWTPTRPDIAAQVRTWMIATVPAPIDDPEGFAKSMARLTKALKV